MKLAIIGAGMAGLTCAHEAASAGHDVTVFDKGRGPGGRLSTRRVDLDGGVLRFDHGASGFRPRSPEFTSVSKHWVAKAWLAPWQPRTANRTGSLVTDTGVEDWVTGIPGMNGLIKGLTLGLDVRFDVRIQALNLTASGWRLTFEDETPDFQCEGVVCATPAEQAGVLLKDAAPELASIAAGVRSDPCWTIMLGYETPLSIAHDLIISDDPPFRRMIRNSSKPERSEAETWVLQATPDWTKERLEQSKEDIAAEAVSAFSALTKAEETPLIAMAHRWLYSQITKAADTPANWDEDLRIGSCGDWHIGPDIESAWLSGRVLGERLKSI